MDEHPRPLPRPLVECPWCDAPLELDGGADLLCRACRVMVELTEPRAARRPSHRRAA